MPVYCEVYQLIIPKNILESKYKGKVTHLKKDYEWNPKVDHGKWTGAKQNKIYIRHTDWSLSAYRETIRRN